jgi:DNA-binding beta-propeller fold protein YncE
LCYLPEIPQYSTGGSTERYIAGIAALPDGNRLVCFHNSGEEEPSWQKSDGNFAGKFSSVHNHLNALDAAYDKRLDRVIMTDLPDGYSPEHRITVVDRLGRNIPNMPHTFGSFGSEPGQFNVPAGVAVDSQSRIYVADLNNNRIQAFTSQGDYITQFTGVTRPRGIEVDSTDRIIVADTGNRRLVILGWNGSALEMGGVISNVNFSSVVDVACGDNDELFTLNAGLNAVACFTSDGTWITNLYKPTDGSSGTLFRPRGIACLPGNQLVVSDSGNNRVVEIDAGDVIPEPTSLLLLHVPAAFFARYYQQK